ncbi:flagellar biosynthesis protein FlhF [Pleionea sediminis]|uniref:flagellar biosynthesis protein FlhF n=1 Tax=Pleionea sediminis TaxID=2569479 RepID=UPI0011848805|nr:flagellar biosynthesis protein FlhF [Pleionea sediminis]
MKIRRFFAKDMRSALNQVSAELGPDAAILSSTNVNGGVEVVAATDYEEAMMQTRRTPRSSQSNAIEDSSRFSETPNDDYHDPVEMGRHANAKQEGTSNRYSQNISSRSLSGRIGGESIELNESRTNNNYNEPASEPSQGESGLLKFLKQQEQKFLNSKRESKRTKEDRRDRLSVGRKQDDISEESLSNAFLSPAQHSEHPIEQPFPKIEWSQEPTLVAMKEELSLLRNLLQEQVSQLAWDKQSKISPIGVALKREFTNLGLSPSIIEPIGQMCESEQDFECAWQKGLALLAKKIMAGDDDILANGGVYALVGPTGVGKTTTLAKLAAKHVIKNGPESIGLITTDSFRIAAHDQLKTYGRILKVPVRIAGDEKTLKEALYHFNDKKLVLIDTAGMSQHDERMTQLMQCLSQGYRTIQNYLVLSATSQSSVLNDAIKLFRPFKLSGTLVTKLDEAASLGEIISTIIENRLRVVYTTDGQRVPEDIRVARAHHLVSKMVWLMKNRQLSSREKEATGTHQ